MSSGSAARLLLVDNFDSFTYMLADQLRVAGAAVDVVRADIATVAMALGEAYDGVVISPGPGRPEEAGESIAIAAASIAARRALLGVCLGHQAIALACGGTVARVAPIHGKVGGVRHDGSGLFATLPSPFAATRYHSLAVAMFAPPLVASAWSEDGTVMALRHADAPAHGVQFHPESVASETGPALLEAFVRVVRGGA